MVSPFHPEPIILFPTSQRFPIPKHITSGSYDVISGLPGTSGSGDVISSYIKTRPRPLHQNEPNLPVWAHITTPPLHSRWSPLAVLLLEFVSLL